MSGEFEDEKGNIEMAKLSDNPFIWLSIIGFIVVMCFHFYNKFV